MEHAYASAAVLSTGEHRPNCNSCQAQARASVVFDEDLVAISLVYRRSCIENLWRLVTIWHGRCELSVADFGSGPQLGAIVVEWSCVRRSCCVPYAHPS